MDGRRGSIIKRKSGTKKGENKASSVGICARGNNTLKRENRNAALVTPQESRVMVSRALGGSVLVGLVSTISGRGYVHQKISCAIGTAKPRTHSSQHLVRIRYAIVFPQLLPIMSKVVFNTCKIHPLLLYLFTRRYRSMKTRLPIRSRSFPGIYNNLGSNGAISHAYIDLTTSEPLRRSKREEEGNMQEHFYQAHESVARL